MTWTFVARVPGFHRGPARWHPIDPPGSIEKGTDSPRIWWFRMRSRAAAGTAQVMFRQANRGKPMRTAVLDLPSIPLRWRTL